ncbi:MAG: nucleotide exchange factor GrpE [Anaerolineae bacterium]|jgi:molecular chaperone GrpE|nr:nucleotide exchange factor GrpE [Anaerolineae bacterium]
MTDEDLRDSMPEAEPAEAPGESADSAAGMEADAGALLEQLTQVEAALAEAEKKVAEYLDGWQRSQAAFANFRKRTESEQSQYRLNANAQLLLRLLPIADDFRRAFEVIPAAYADDPWLDGIRLVERKVKSVLESERVTPIDLKPGDIFNPARHEAVLYQEVEGFNEGEVVTEIETGYLIGDRVLRPSLVVVAKGPSAPPSVADEASPQSDAPAEDVVDA